MKKLFYLLIAIIIPLECVSQLHFSSDSKNINMLSSLTNFSQTAWWADIEGDYAYIATAIGTGLRIVDISDPEAPIEVGSILNTDECTGVDFWHCDRVAVKGDYAYVTYYDGLTTRTHYRLYVYDVSDPEQPVELTHLDLPDYCVEIFLVGECLLITNLSNIPNGHADILIVDVSDPNEPEQIGIMEFHDYYVLKLAIDGNTVYISDGKKFTVYEFSDPSSPVELGSKGGIIGETHIIAQSGDILYVHDSEFGIRFFDVSDPSDIKEAGCIEKESDPIGYMGMDVDGDYLYGATDDFTLVVYDISDLQSPEKKGELPLTYGTYYIVMYYCDGMVYVAADTKGFHIIDVSDPEFPVGTGCFLSNGINVSVAVKGDAAYISTYSSMVQVLDVSDPEYPVTADSLTFITPPKYLTIQGDTLMVPASKTLGDFGFYLYDISDPFAAQEIGYLPRDPGYHDPNHPKSMHIHGNYAYAAMGAGGIQIYDITELDEPVFKAHWSEYTGTPGEGYSVRNSILSYPYLFAPAGKKGLYVLDVSDPDSIKVAANVPTDHYAVWIDLSENDHLYLARYGGVDIYDVSDPLDPHKIGTYSGNLRKANHLLLTGDTLYVVDMHPPAVGLHVLDVSDPYNPVEVAYHKTPGLMGMQVDVENDLIYMSDGSHFEIFQLDIPAGIEDNNIIEYDGISIFPNPASEKCNISLTEPVFGNTILEIYDLLGNMVYRSTKYLPAGSKNLCELDISNIMPGYYFVKIDVAGKCYTGNITIKH